MPTLGEIPLPLELDRDAFADAVDGLYKKEPLMRDGKAYPVLEPNAEVRYGGLIFKVKMIPSGGAVIEFRPEGVEVPESVLLQINGYGQGPSTMLTTKILWPLVEKMRERKMVGVAYGAANRGSESLITNQAWWGVRTMQKHFAEQMREVMAMVQENSDGTALPTALEAHSEGGQKAAYMLQTPEKYGLMPGQIKGVHLINPMGLRRSQDMLATPEFLTKLVPQAVPHVLKSIITRKGLVLPEDLAFDFFIGEGNQHGKNEQRILQRIYPAPTDFFLDSLTVGTTPRLKEKHVSGLPIAYTFSGNDQLMGEDFTVRHTDKYLRSLKARVADFGWNGKHFSPIVMLDGETREEVEYVLKFQASAAIEWAFQHIPKAQE